VKVLIVDDSSTQRRIVKNTMMSLEQYSGWEFFEAESGLNGAKLFGMHHFDLVFTDWNMDNGNGLDLVKNIRGMNPTVPVVMFTSETSSQNVNEAIRAKVSDYLAKPLTGPALKDKLIELHDEFF
jgi:two-component system chemotaxis response regulator CheY